MDLGIKELGITFLVGAFTILGLELILYYFLGIPLTGFFQGKLGLQGKKRTSNHRNTEVRDQAMRTAVFIGLAFAVGILAEDISFKYVDSIQSPIASIPDTLLPESVIKRLDLSKESSRVQTLIHDLRGEAKPSQLAIDLAKAEAFVVSDPENGKKVQDWIKNPVNCKPSDSAVGECPSSKQVADSILKLYYQAKNRAYDRENYYDEMKRIQSRLDFSRSISMIAFVYFVVGAVVGLVLLIPAARNSSPAKQQQFRFRAPIRIPGVLVILLLTSFSALWAFSRESDEFNKRAFGYYSSMLVKEADDRKQQAVLAKSQSSSENRKEQGDPEKSESSTVERKSTESSKNPRSSSNLTRD